MFRRDRYPKADERKAWDTFWPRAKAFVTLYGVGIPSGCCSYGYAGGLMFAAIYVMWLWSLFSSMVDFFASK